MAKHRLICIEGPAGCGKTTFCQALAAHAIESGIACRLLDEFSDSPLGTVLQTQLPRFSNSRLKRDSLETLLMCIADKTYNLLQARTASNELLIMDRGFFTQTVLVLPHLTNQSDQTLACDLIHASNHWLATNFSLTTLLLQLAPQENLHRLSQRLQRELTAQEQNIMQQEIAEYAKLANHPDAALLGLQVLEVPYSPNQLASIIQTQLTC